jgi:predicted nucleotidyltransferase
MRLTKKEVKYIKSAIIKYIPKAKIYLFGSILKDNIKGGDVDIYIITKNIPPFIIKSSLKFELENYLSRPVDLIFHKDFNLLIEKEAKKGVKL